MCHPACLDNGRHYQDNNEKSERESISCSVMSGSATLWAVHHQALLSMGFSRQEYWSG